MKWKEVRELYPDQFVKFVVIESRQIDNKEYVDEVAIIKAIKDENESKKEFAKCKIGQFIYSTKNEKVVIELAKSKVENKRKEYLVISTVSFLVGFILYGLIGVFAKEDLEIPFPYVVTFILYGFLGGLLIGGIANGIILFSGFIKTKELSIKILSVVIFPLTIIIVFQVGILSFIPYWIYNVVKLKR